MVVQEKRLSPESLLISTVLSDASQVSPEPAQSTNVLPEGIQLTSELYLTTPVEVRAEHAEPVQVVAEEKRLSPEGMKISTLLTNETVGGEVQPGNVSTSLPRVALRSDSNLNMPPVTQPGRVIRPERVVAERRQPGGMAMSTGLHAAAQAAAKRNQIMRRSLTAFPAPMMGRMPRSSQN